MYTVYQLVSRIPLPSRLSAAHLPPGGRFVGRETRPLLTGKRQLGGGWLTALGFLGKIHESTVSEEVRS